MASTCDRRQSPARRGARPWGRTGPMGRRRSRGDPQPPPGPLPFCGCATCATCALSELSADARLAEDCGDRGSANLELDSTKPYPGSSCSVCELGPATSRSPGEHIKHISARVPAVHHRPDLWLIRCQRHCEAHCCMIRSVAGGDQHGEEQRRCS